MRQFERSTSKIELAIDLDKAHSKAEKVLGDPIDPYDFSDIYRDVDRDVAYVKKMEKTFKEDAEQSSPELREIRKSARVFEAIVHEQTELSEWFGQSATTITPSRFDDIKNGVDDIVEFQEGPGTASHLALAIDVTTSPDMRAKLDRIREEIKRGHLTEIKYFKSEVLDIKGLRQNVPRVVVGAERKTIHNLMELWLNNDTRALAEHPIQIQMLEEIRSQLIAFRDYAESVGQEKLVATYNKTLKIVESVFKEKKIRPGKHIDDFKNDEVFLSIQDFLQNLGQSGKA